MLNLIPFANWLRLAGGLILFLGPGMALVSFHPRRRTLDKTSKVALGFAFSVSAWAIVLVWLQPVGVHLGPVGMAALLGIGWLVAGWRFSGRHVEPPVANQANRGSWPRRVLWLLIGLSAGLGLFALRDVLVGPGSDSYHHTLIIQLFVNQGGIPSNYQPFADLTTFRYHFGFHAFAALLVSLSGIQAQFVAPILCQLLVALSALTVAYLTETLTGNRLAGLVSAGLVGLGMSFPSYMIHWGRYPQLTGLALLPVLVAELAAEPPQQWNGRAVGLMAVLSAGLALTHYRIAIMAAAAGVVVYLNWVLPFKARSREPALVSFGKFAAVAGSGLVLISPWLIRLVQQQGLGYVASLGPVDPGYFSLTRLGAGASDPTNIPILVILAAAMLTGILLRERAPLMMLAWSFVLLAVTSLPLVRLDFDPVSLVVSLYVPIAVAIGWLFGEWDRWLQQRLRSWKTVPILLVLTPILVLGGTEHATPLKADETAVTSSDMTAMAWIQSHTPLSAKFVIDSFEFPFQTGFITGIDAGYWIPLLADRQTDIPPLVYVFERSDDPNLVNNLIAYHKAQETLTSTSAARLLADSGYSYVYVDARSGMVDTTALNSAPDYRLVYSEDGVSIYQIQPAEAGNQAAP